MWESFNSLMEFAGPFLVNVGIGYWVYLRVEQHAYAKVAGFVVFLLFCECDRIRLVIESRTQRLSYSLNRIPRKLSEERRQGLEI